MDLDDGEGQNAEDDMEVLLYDRSCRNRSNIWVGASKVFSAALFVAQVGGSGRNGPGWSSLWLAAVAASIRRRHGGFLALRILLALRGFPKVDR